MFIPHQAIGFAILFILFWAFAYAVTRWLKDRTSRSPVGSSRSRQKPSRKPVESDLYSRLLTVCLGDRAKAERLIAFEQKRNPKLSRYAAIAEALDSVAYDNRRRW